MSLVAAEQIRCDSDAPRRARSWAVDCVQRSVPSADPDALSTTALVVSELVTNAVRAGCVAATLQLELLDSALSVAVTDDAPGSPEVQHPSASEHHGRGLRIVEAYSRDWGFHSVGTGKRVWATIALAPS